MKPRNLKTLVTVGLLVGTLGPLAIHAGTRSSLTISATAIAAPSVSITAVKTSFTVDVGEALPVADVGRHTITCPSANCTVTYSATAWSGNGLSKTAYWWTTSGAGEFSSTTSQTMDYTSTSAKTYDLETRSSKMPSWSTPGTASSTITVEIANK